MTVLMCNKGQAAAMVDEEKGKPVEVDDESCSSSQCGSESSRVGSGSCMFRTNCLENPMRNIFYRYGAFLGRHPLPFVIIPLLMAAAMSVGLSQFEVRNDTEYLVTPKNGPAKVERRFVEKYFHVDQDGGFIPDKSASLDGFTDIIIASNDQSNVLVPDIVQAVIDIDKYVRNISVVDDLDMPYNFQSICATWGDQCIPHPILLIYQYNAALASVVPVEYPNFNYQFLGHSLGDVDLVKNTSLVKSAGAMRITFFVKYESDSDRVLANRWFTRVQELLQHYETGQNITVYHSAENSLTEQFDAASSDIAPKFAAPFILLILFSIVSCMMNDWVRSKPSLAFAGVFSAGLGLASSFGFLSAMGVRAVPQVGLVPFLALGVGVDNMFILISSWRRSDTDEIVGRPMRERVELRMAMTMKEAALSITITSLTDVLAFGIGAITDFPTVELFCLFTGLSIVVSYFFCITFFASIMAFSGIREESNRHCVTMKKVFSKKESEERSWWYRVWCSGGKPGRNQALNDEIKETRISILPSSQGPTLCPHGNPLKPVEADHIIMKFFKDYFGPVLMNPWVKAFVILWWISYVTISIYGCLHMRRGVSFEKLANVDSYLAHYYTAKDTYFNTFGPSVSVMVADNLNYSDPSTQQKLFEMMETFENETAFFYKDATKSWLSDYLRFLQMTQQQPQSEEEFISILKNVFLKQRGYDMHKVDITFNEDGTAIIASRFYLQSLWYKKTEDMMLESRRLAESITDFNVTTFHQTFIYFDQPVVVWHNTLQNIVIAIVCMFIVAILFVPHPISAMWVTIATASIEAGVIGFMTLWDVNVDFVSMTYLILCIGFAVDFSVHITYGFIASEQPTASDRAKEALYILGYPVLQSGISTILGISFLSTSISYLFFSFFKTMFLVIIFGVWHALFVLPVFLSVLSGQFDTLSKKKCTNSNCNSKDCKQRITEKSRQFTEKGKHLIPLIFSECEQCITEGGSVLGDERRDQLMLITEKCSVV